MYRRLPAFVLAFHGCDRSIGERILGSSTQHLNPSLNKYDWLGNGMYFWESSPRRAYDFAVEACKNRKISRGRIRHPFVVGAIIDLGNCFNLLEASALSEMQQGYELLKAQLAVQGLQMPVNAVADGNGSYLVRNLDCAVIEAVHTYREKKQLASYDTVRAALWEGEPLYSGAGILKKNHIQICVRDPYKIKGYFRVREIDGFAVSGWDALGMSAYTHFCDSKSNLSPRRAARPTGATVRPLIKAS
ncbi:hypothetical protein [Burkholderia cepacia]|uniref:hypothetical protein n=1 Tax=Burkholderia cepacia TaxID=292 RepID=UPI001588B119|nr:hypothetical protein [Burkholderia cepacia]